MTSSPFPPPSAVPGTGQISLTYHPPTTQSLSTLTYQYPLKLISPDPHLSPSHHPITTVFLLSYGGGLVGGDTLTLDITLHPRTRLVLLTQGSTKIFKAPARGVRSGQEVRVRVGRGAAICYLPDPSQPFGESAFEQRQVFEVEDGGCGVCLLDWVSEGRRARGERWGFWEWSGRNEVRERKKSDGSVDAEEFGQGRLVLRDLVVLSDQHGFGEAGGGRSLLERTEGMAVFGTLILHGEMFAALGHFLMEIFSGLPRIGAKDWNETREKSDEDRKGKKGLDWNREGLLWTAARVRGCVVVKFGAKEIDVAKGWLFDLLSTEGTVENEFGHQALFCLR